MLRKYEMELDELKHPLMVEESSYECPDERLNSPEKTDMTREQRKKELKGNIQLTVILIMYMWMVSAILIRLFE